MTPSTTTVVPNTSVMIDVASSPFTVNPAEEGNQPVQNLQKYQSCARQSAKVAVLDLPREVTICGCCTIVVCSIRKNDKIFGPDEVCLTKCTVTTVAFVNIHKVQKRQVGLAVGRRDSRKRVAMPSAS